MPNSLIEVKDLCISRGGNSVIEELNWELTKGPPLAIVGESGSGKTTLLMALLGLIPHQKGSIRIGDKALVQLDRKERCQKLGLVFQDFQLFPHLTVTENLKLAPTLLGKATNRASEWLTQLNIGTLGDRYPHQLSGGQKQRAAIARSLMLEPDILFFDEPSSALDAVSTEALGDVIKMLNHKTQIVIVSHDWPFIESCCPRTVTMKDGHF